MHAMTHILQYCGRKISMQLIVAWSCVMILPMLYEHQNKSFAELENY